MTQLTQESFERILQDRLQEAVAPLATKQDVREAVGELARITSSGFARTEERFDEVEKRLDVRPRRSPKTGHGWSPENRP